MISTTIGTALWSVAPLVPLQSSGNPLWGIGFLGVAGVVAIYVGWGKYQSSRLVGNTPTESARSMAAGRTELEGEAVAKGDPFDQPFGDGEAVVAAYRIKERERDEDGDEHWETKQSGTLAAPFFLDDGTGQALIDADGDVELEVSDENTTRYTIDRGGDPPEAVENFLQADGGGPVSVGPSEVDVGDRHRRYVQEVIPPGSDVYVFGGARTTADEAGSNEDRLAIGPDEATDRFIVSDMDEDELVSALGRSALFVIAIGVVLLAGAFYLVVTEYGLAG